MQPIVNIAINAVRQASKLIIRSMDDLKVGHLDSKARKEFTRRVENLAFQEISNTILKSYPEHQIATPEAEELDQNRYIWIVDAIDGAVNYAHNLPHFCTSIAIKFEHETQHAVIYDPIRQDLFIANRGEGAFLNERRIRVRNNKQLETALLGTGFPYQQTQHLKPYINTFMELFPQSDGIRRSGSAALDLAYVAAAHLDGFWEFSLKEHNMAAGALLIKEAGGLISDFQGEERYLENGNIVAGTPKIFKAMLKAIQSCLKE